MHTSKAILFYSMISVKQGILEVIESPKVRDREMIPAEILNMIMVRLIRGHRQYSFLGYFKDSSELP